METGRNARQTFYLSQIFSNKKAREAEGAAGFLLSIRAMSGDDEHARKKRDDHDDQDDEDQDFRNAGGSTGHTAEAEKARDCGDEKKDQDPLQHVCLPCCSI